MLHQGQADDDGELLTVGQAARAVGMTSEALRHYDRIGLVTPGWRDDATRYRYYTPQDIVRLKTVKALRRLGLPLENIRQAMQYDTLEDVVDFLRDAEASADRAIAELQDAKRTMRLARAGYEAKLGNGIVTAHGTPETAAGTGDVSNDNNDSDASRDDGVGRTVAADHDSENGDDDRFAARAVVRHLPSRVILPSRDMSEPTLQNLWDYLRPFYDAVGPTLRDRFRFEDQAGVYAHGGVSRLFAICERHEDIEGLVTLPEGDYLCVDCTEEERGDAVRALARSVRKRYGVAPAFHLELVVLTGLLTWNYQIQIPTNASSNGLPANDTTADSSDGHDE